MSRKLTYENLPAPVTIKIKILKANQVVNRHYLSNLLKLGQFHVITHLLISTGWLLAIRLRPGS